MEEVVGIHMRAWQAVVGIDGMHKRVWQVVEAVAAVDNLEEVALCNKAGVSLKIQEGEHLGERLTGYSGVEHLELGAIVFGVGAVGVDTVGWCKSIHSLLRLVNWIHYRFR